MAFSLAAKIGSVSTALVGGGTVVVYCAWDHITLYEVEREVLDKNSLLDVSVESNQPTVFFFKKGETTHTKDNSPWVCKISVKSGVTISSDGSKLKGKLPTVDGDKENKEKQDNKRKLVKVCSSKRDDTSNSKKVTSTLELENIESEDKLIEFLFGTKSESAA